MATNKATWSNQGTLSESVDVTLRNSDDRTELTHHILEDIEENLDTLKNEKGNENAKNFDTENEESQWIRKLTEKGEEEKIRRLKQRRTNALTAVSHKRTDINKLMTDQRNLDVVKAELNQLDSLCQHLGFSGRSLTCSGRFVCGRPPLMRLFVVVSVGEFFLLRLFPLIF